MIEKKKQGSMPETAKHAIITRKLTTMQSTIERNIRLERHYEAECEHKINAIIIIVIIKG